MQVGGTVAAVGLAADMKLNTTVAPFILRGVRLLGVDSVNCPMDVRQTLWNKLAVEVAARSRARPGAHDRLRRTAEHFDAYLKGMVRGRTVVRIGGRHAP